MDFPREMSVTGQGTEAPVTTNMVDTSLLIFYVIPYGAQSRPILSFTLESPGGVGTMEVTCGDEVCSPAEPQRKGPPHENVFLQHADV